MLLRFRFSNFRSFRDEQELSLVASSTSGEGVFRPGGIREGVLPVIAMYGANASGKTNVLRALHYMATIVRVSHAHWEPDAPVPRDAFGSEEGNAAPSTFACDFLIDNVRYQYGFSVNSDAVVDEWLFAYPRGKRQGWFNRVPGRPIVFSAKLPGDNRTIEKLTRKNSLFLSAAAQNNHEALSPIYRWFSSSLAFVIGRAPFLQQVISLCNTPQGRTALARLVSFADLGITDLALSEEKIPDQVQGLVTAFSSFLSLVEEQVKEVKQIPWFPDATSVPQLLQRQLRLIHRLGNSTFTSRQDQESNGTLAYLTLLGSLIPTLEQGGIICIDEIDASLHPLLAVQLIKLFGSPATNKHSAQLIFNTHDTNLLSADVLRRDEIWFTEKRPDGSSHLYPLTDFKPRKQEKLERGYLQGRYGAIPFLNADCLTPFETEDAETR